MSDAAALVAYVQQELAARADPAKAGPMQAYMKTAMPFHGVTKPERVPVARGMRKFPPPDRATCERSALALWNLGHREECYLAIDYLVLWKQYHTPAALPLLERLIREGAWWDLVDAVTGFLVSPIHKKHRTETAAVMDRWIESDDFWVRRAAILSQLKHKGETDLDQLFRYCLRCADEKEFFIRKAIGWALRDASWTHPEAIRDFLLAHREELSALSFREGAKQLKNLGMLS